MTSPTGTLRGVDAGGQPERDAGVAQVVGTFREVKGVLVDRESSLTRSPPGDAVRRGVDVVPCCVPEQAPVGCNTEAPYVFAQHTDEHQRYRHRACRLGCPPFQGVDLMDSAVIRPLLAGSHDAALQVQ